MSEATQPQRREPKGAVESTGPRARYLHIKHGCLCEESKTEVAGWIEKTVDVGRTGQTMQKWIKPYDGIEAWVNDIEWRDHEYDGKDYSGWRMHMEAGGTHYVLEFPLVGRATKRLLLTARNINFEEPLEISAWTDKEGNLAVNFKQNGQKIDQFYKKGDMKNCPEPVVKTVMGKQKWDWEATNDFLWREMNDVITPIVRRIAEERGTPSQFTGPTGTTEATTAAAPASDDDIPF